MIKRIVKTTFVIFFIILFAVGLTGYIYLEPLFSSGPRMGDTKNPFGNPLIYVPAEFGIKKVLYVKEEAWGFGPGANETGIRVYELPEETAKIIQQQQIEYFYSLPSNRFGGQNWEGHYKNWSATPIEVTRDWTDYMSIKGEDYSKETPSVSHYMNAYGFGIEIDSQIKQLVDDAIKTQGNYYAYGRIGVIIVIPDKKRVVYVYNG